MPFVPILACLCNVCREVFIPRRPVAQLMNRDGVKKFVATGYLPERCGKCDSPHWHVDGRMGPDNRCYPKRDGIRLGGSFRRHNWGAEGKCLRCGQPRPVSSATPQEIARAVEGLPSQPPSASGSQP